MKESYLIQRLKKPFKIEDKLKNLQNMFSFGGGLTNGGLSKEEVSLIRNIFSFDYMGSSEFEWGAVPEAMKKIAQEGLKKNLITAARILEYKDKKSKFIYIICKKEELSDVINRIKKFAINSYNKTKKMVMLNESLSDESKYNKDIVGWLELDNGYFFFSDENMFNKTCQLFGINKEVYNGM